MTDRYGRNIDYLRISITDRCNLRCKYCMPEEPAKRLPGNELETWQFLEVVKAAASAGIAKVRITGGEPLVRDDCIDILDRIKRIDGIQSTGITTNGTLLAGKLDELEKADTDEINVSLDTMDADKYRTITGRDCFDEVLEGIVSASERGIKTKINTVVFDDDSQTAELAANGILTEDFRSLILLTKNLPLDVRFIEAMPIGCGKNCRTVSNADLLKAIENEFGTLIPDKTNHGFGPAVYFRPSGFKGSIGLISAISSGFCNQCSRVRLTSRGFLKACLCYDDGEDLSKYLTCAGTVSDAVRHELKMAVERVIYNKPAKHCFWEPDKITEAGNMFSIGG